MLIYNFDLEKKNHEILAPLQYKPVYNISHSEKWGKKIQNGACMVYNDVLESNLLLKNLVIKGGGGGRKT